MLYRKGYLLLLVCSTDVTHIWDIFENLGCLGTLDFRLFFDIFAVNLMADLEKSSIISPTIYCTSPLGIL